ncbi:antibiotic biosynthesis monooxygenase family protein [Fodinibius sp. Rm-B-1B1-1]|uniref:antibiotic biosynthesis monooxygenase family protein n=1 Tax=Fodinibius alkaliphilus TaxID=3140241 RepID=UPI00315AAF7F
MKRCTEQISKLLNNGSSVYSATFVFRIKNYDSEFESLNSIIDEVANSNSGFLGKESWSNEEENKRAVVYYWDSLESLKQFSNNPNHQKAKQNYNKWYSGYEIIISEVVNFKSDNGLQ